MASGTVPPGGAGPGALVQGASGRFVSPQVQGHFVQQHEVINIDRRQVSDERLCQVPSCGRNPLSAPGSAELGPCGAGAGAPQTPPPRGRGSGQAPRGGPRGRRESEARWPAPSRPHRRLWPELGFSPPEAAAFLFCTLQHPQGQPRDCPRENPQPCKSRRISWQMNYRSFKSLLADGLFVV